MKAPADRLHCVLMGDESLLVQCADALLSRQHSIVAVVTGNPTIGDWATGLDITVLPPGEGLEKQLSGLDYDWLFSAANLRIIPEPVWKQARHGAANFHDGPLPRYAGLNAPTWAILADETRYGVTWHALSAGVDEGDIYTLQDFDISPDETAFTLNTKCFEAGIATFVDMIQSIEDGTLLGVPQDISKRTYFGKYHRPEAAATLRFDRPAAELDLLCRALDYGPGYANPVIRPKLRTPTEAFSITALEVLEERSNAEPGMVLSSDQIATKDGVVRVSGLRDARGIEVQPSSRLHAGTRLPIFSDAEEQRLTEATAAIARHEAYFKARLAQLRDPDLYDVAQEIDGVDPKLDVRAVPLPHALTGDSQVAALTGYIARVSEQDAFDVAYRNEELSVLCSEFPGYFAPSVPLRVDASGNATVADLTNRIRDQMAELQRRRTYLGDLIARSPGLAAPRHTIGIAQSRQFALEQAIPGCAITFVLPANDQSTLHIVYDKARLSKQHLDALARRLDLAVKAFAGDDSLAINDLPLMSEDERTLVLYGRNKSDRSYDTSTCVHTLIERQVDLTPDATAVVFEDQSLTYRELDQAANRVADALVQLGIGPDGLVGLYVRRSLDLVVGAFGIHKAGGAYVPLDPAFPTDRVALMIEDSGLSVVLTRRAMAATLPGAADKLLCLEDVALDKRPVERPQSGVSPNNLAYVIYTSGSTGRPKGVMVEHGNVVNFFAGMDDRIAVHEQAQSVWLAVTSLSFDISVLELFWTLSRGFKVVINSDDSRSLKPVAAGYGAARFSEGMQFSLFYWGNDAAAGPRKYQLLLDGAKFADQNGFHAIWTPERHFHAFGGPYPNPAVTGAAVAAVTKNLSIRAGSCVLPLHHPARVAEEWAVVDNISNGRVAIAFASGWMPQDFLLRPENAPPDNRASLVRDIDVVRRLWRGDPVVFEAPDGKKINLVTQPRPVQKELPVWVTTAGNPDTYREAARLGANVLTHLLGQSIPELAEKIRVYRETLVEVGRDPADHTFTLMLHTLIGSDREEVRELAREPMMEYLRSAAALIKQYAWAFPAFKKPQGVDKPADIDLQSLDAAEMDAILEFAFLRYFEDSGLFGTIDDARQRVTELKAIGVDEIACLIDFGVPTEVVLESLVPLAAVVKQSQPSVAAVADGDFSVGANIKRHGVSHLQCTPSMARMLMMNVGDREQLRHVQHMFIGGEALQGTLLSDLREATTASIENMYGPTETTIWSSTCTAKPCEGVVPLGPPIANTQLYVLDRSQRPAPPGLPGELYIGGDGVARGYLGRKDLTQERFLSNPFVPGGRVYRTGDLVRFSEDGALKFLGRADFQVKVRGYRIELGEIEARIGTHQGVRESVVIAREDIPNDVRIVAYLRVNGPSLSDDVLRQHVRQTLPDYMVPSHFVTLESFPLTPNAKVDRKALPRPGEAMRSAPEKEYVAPADDVQRQIAETFKRVLNVGRVGLLDSFFALGGHSLLAVQVHRELRATLAPELTITDIFRFPTVSGLAAHLADRDKAGEQLERVADRAALRRQALSDRRAGPKRSREQV